MKLTTVSKVRDDLKLSDVIVGQAFGLDGDVFLLIEDSSITGGTAISLCDLHNGYNPEIKDFTGDLFIDVIYDVDMTLTEI